MFTNSLILIIVAAIFSKAYATKLSLIWHTYSIGFMVGVVLSIVLFSIIDSSVCAVIVCFAGSPVEFHRNHQELSHEMRHAWREVWPGSLDIDSSGMGMASPMI